MYQLRQNAPTYVAAYRDDPDVMDTSQLGERDCIRGEERRKGRKNCHGARFEVRGFGVQSWALSNTAFLDMDTELSSSKN